MARESSAFVGSGISVLRQIYNVPAMHGTNSVLLNYEDVNSLMGVVQHSGLTVGGTAVQLTAPENRLRGRRKLFVHNTGTGVVYVGGSGVSTSNGYPVASGASLEFDVLDFGNIWAVSASTSSLRILEMK